MTDLALVRRLRAGEEAAFEEFFDAYFPRLYRFACVRLGGDEDAAEEVVQTSLIRALDRIGTFRGEAALFTWLGAICRREIGAWVERNRRAPGVPLEDSLAARSALETVALADVDPQALLARSELAEFVRATLDFLPGRYGDVLEWRYIDGLHVSEIAERLGVGYKAAESVLSRAREAFREAFTLLPDQT
ncbi:MAG: RNA polymerase sigma factor [Vicinamibacterales bacterium]